MECEWWSYVGYLGYQGLRFKREKDWRCLLVVYTTLCSSIYVHASHVLCVTVLCVCQRRLVHRRLLAQICFSASHWSET